jgi:hypothetical protein
LGRSAEVIWHKTVNSRLPPRPATWLLERFGSKSRLDPLIGDLAEEFASGRSRFWYWQEATGALGVELIRTLRTHALSFLAAIIIGCVLTSIWEFGVSRAFEPLYASLADVSRNPRTWAALVCVAGLQLNGILDCVLTFGTVWLVTRIHRAHQRVVLAAFVAALAAPSLPEIARLASQAVIHNRTPNELVPIFVPACLQAVMTLAAGLWMIRTQCFAGMDRRTRVVGILVAAGASLVALIYDPRRVAVVFTELDRRTRFVAIFAAVLATLVALIYRARLVGALPQARPEWAVLDALDIASVSYLAYLLWRPRASSPSARHPQTVIHSPAGTGSR